MATLAAVSRYTHDRRTILGVEVFSVGKHTPSNGPEIEVTADDLDAIVAAFDNGTPRMVPVKFGHTSDAFNIAQAAELLGITEGLITGEGNEGDGAILPGTVTKLTRVQNKLLADFDVIAPVAPMIADGLLKGISIEITGNVLSAVTLLGAELPAVKDLVPLQAATVLKEGTIYAFAMGTDAAKVAPRKFHTHAERLRSLSWFAMDLGLPDTATIDDVIARLNQLKDHEEVPLEGPMRDEIRTLLSLKKDVSEADVLAAVTALKAKSEASPKPSFGERMRSLLKLGSDASEDDVLAKLGDTEPKPTSSGFSESEAKSLFAEQETKIAVLEHENKVRRWAEKTRNFSAVQGTPEELAEQVTEAEEKVGADAAERMMVGWELTQKYAKEAGTLQAIGIHGDGTLGDYEGAVTKWKADNKPESGVSTQAHDAAAHKAVMAAEPALYAEYSASRRKINKGNE